jgi:hypothetical protein
VPAALRLPALLALVAIAYGVVTAVRHAWVCDDAFISFRYAENLVNGMGLVFNPGERVEGHSNLLWTLGIALGMKLGAGPEAWSVAWGVAFHAATVALLAWRSLREPGAWRWPVAAMAAAVHRDWAVFATSGLETSCFTFAVVLGYVLLTGPRPRPAWAGGALAAAAMIRPDGPLFAAVAAAFLLAAGRPRFASAARFAAAFAALWLPYTAARVAYYGEFFPNTYYAKSAALAWWSQGWTYARLYFVPYWPLLAAIPLAACAWLAPPRAAAGSDDRGHWPRDAALAAAFALAYSLYVVRVGGDFMYARLLVPATPFLLVLLEMALQRLAAGRVAVAAAAAAAAAIAVWLAPDPLPAGREVAGIVGERHVYTRAFCDEIERRGRVLRAFFAGLPVRVGFFGAEARLVYYARPQVAIECDTGLTDRFVARQPLARRGRVGHEKRAPLGYLLDRRKVHFLFQRQAMQVLDPGGTLPREGIDFADVPGVILYWDGPVMAELRERGAAFADFPARLDQVIARLPELTDAQVRATYAAMERFYFDGNPDPARRAPFVARLSGAVPRQRTPDGS